MEERGEISSIDVPKIENKKNKKESPFFELSHNNLALYGILN
jgi:hypothetical protein